MKKTDSGKKFCKSPRDNNTIRFALDGHWLWLSLAPITWWEFDTMNQWTGEHVCHGHRCNSKKKSFRLLLLLCYYSLHISWLTVFCMICNVCVAHLRKYLKCDVVFFVAIASVFLINWASGSRSFSCVYTLAYYYLTKLLCLHLIWSVFVMRFVCFYRFAKRGRTILKEWRVTLNVYDKTICCFSLLCYWRVGIDGVKFMGAIAIPHFNAPNGN